MQNVAIISLWEPGFNGIEKSGRKLEGIVSEKNAKKFIDILHYPYEAMTEEYTTLPITHIEWPEGSGEFRRVG